MPAKKKTHEHTKSMNPVTRLDLTKIKQIQLSQGAEYVQAKPKKLGKVEALITSLQKKLHRAELRVKKYQSYFREVKEIARKFKQKHDEVNEKLNEYTKKNEIHQLGNEGKTTKDETGGRNNCNSSLVF